MYIRFFFIGLVALCYQAQAQDSMPFSCGVGFFRPCFGPQKLATIPDFVDKIQIYFKQYVAFLYNDGVDVRGQKIIFPDGGRTVNLHTSESQFYAKSVCSRCPTSFNQFQFERKTNYKKETCALTTSEVYVSSKGVVFFQPGDDTQAWYYGIPPILIHKKMNEVIAQAQKSKSITYSAGCKSMALKMQSLTQESKELSEKIISLSKDKALFKEKDLEEYLKESETDLKDSLKIDEKDSEKNPMRQKLKQLALLLKGIIFYLEDTSLQIAICTIQNDVEQEMRQHFGSWKEFYNSDLIKKVSNRVERQVASSCGSCRSMRTCLKCVNKVAKQATPGEIEKYYDERIAPYCEGNPNKFDRKEG